VKESRSRMQSTVVENCVLKEEEDNENYEIHIRSCKEIN
jgi:hypothetical protein